MRNNLIATYSHDDKEVRFLIRYTFITAFLAGLTIGGIIHTILN